MFSMCVTERTYLEVVLSHGVGHSGQHDAVGAKQYFLENAEQSEANHCGDVHSFQPLLVLTPRQPNSQQIPAIDETITLWHFALYQNILIT
jgi:hypothetical protein